MLLVSFITTSEFSCCLKKRVCKSFITVMWLAFFFFINTSLYSVWVDAKQLGIPPSLQCTFK